MDKTLFEMFPKAQKKWFIYISSEYSYRKIWLYHYCSLKQGFVIPEKQENKKQVHH